MEKKKIKAIVVDDEKPSREALVNYISEFCPQIEVVAECKSAKSAFKSINELEPQLVFLDIEMPRGNGFDLLRMFKEVPFKVIFATAFSDYAIQAFRFSAADYLMKPVKVTELIDAVNKIAWELSLIDTHKIVGTLLENLNSPSEELSRLVIPYHKGFSIINTTDIVFCKADSYCTVFHLTDESVICSSKNLKHYEELLAGKHFLRVHHSYLINIRLISGYSNQDGISLLGRFTCPLSLAYKSAFLKLFKKTN